MQEVQETWVPFLGQKGPLEKKMATHSSVLAWTIPWTEEPGGLQSMGVTKESDMTEQLHFHFHTDSSRTGLLTRLDVCRVSGGQSLNLMSFSGHPQPLPFP